ncbi:hypothetical protein ACFL3R_00735 [Thermodesulfobacteriota bacterium]
MQKGENIKYKIHITTKDGELLNTIDINSNELNWDSTPTKNMMAEEIFEEINKDIERNK